MLLSEAQTFIDKWMIGEPKVFWYYDSGLFYKEVLIITRMSDNVFEVDTQKSTWRKEKGFNKEGIEKLLRKDLLVWRQYASVHEDFRREKTGGCTCGQWAIDKNGLHYPGCDKYNGK